MSSIESIIKGLNKNMKVGAIQLGVQYQELDRIPFSSCRLNYMTYGGLPVGRIVEFYGPDGSGKTTTSLDIIGQAQKKFPDKKVGYCDIEHTFDTEWATKLGVNIEDLVYYDPDSQGAEDVFNTLLDLIDSGELSVMVLDSIGAMVSNQANEKDIGERTYGGISMALTEFAKKVTPVLARTNTLFIGINQERDDMNSMYGGTTTTGGKNWRHSCTMRLQFKKGYFFDNKGEKLSRACENPSGNMIDVHLVKSKICSPDRKVASYPLNYIGGIDYISDLFDVAVKLNIIVQGGAWFTFVDTETGEPMTDENGKELKFQGKNKVIGQLVEDGVLYDYVDKAVKELER